MLSNLRIAVLVIPGLPLACRKDRLEEGKGENTLLSVITIVKFYNKKGGIYPFMLLTVFTDQLLKEV